MSTLDNYMILDRRTHLFKTVREEEVVVNEMRWKKEKSKVDRTERVREKTHRRNDFFVKSRKTREQDFKYEDE